MRAMVIKEFRELVRDRRTLAMMVAIPVVLLIIFGYAANFTVETSQVLITGPEANTLATRLGDNPVAQEDLIISVELEEPSEEAIKTRLQNQEFEAIINTRSFQNDAPLSSWTHLYVDGSELFNAQAVQFTWMRTIAEDTRQQVRDLQANIDKARAQADAMQHDVEQGRLAMTQLQQRLQQPMSQEALVHLLGSISFPTIANRPTIPDTSAFTNEDVDIDQLSTVYFNPDLKTSWMMIPGLIGLIISFIGIVVTSIGLVREREAGTLEQLAVMPLRPGSIILGKILPYFGIALLDAAIISVLGVWIFGVPFLGSVLEYSLVAFIFVFVVLGLGVLISSLSDTTGQAIQMAIMMVVPQVLLSGLIYPLDLMAASVRWIGYGLPLTWFTILSRGIMMRGASLNQMLLPLGVLVGMAILFFGAATLRMHFLLRKGGVTA